MPVPVECDRKVSLHNKDELVSGLLEGGWQSLTFPQIQQLFVEIAARKWHRCSEAEKEKISITLLSLTFIV